jgi:hypothetical protein
MEAEGSLPFWQESAIGHYPDPDASTEQLPTLFP